MNDIQLITNNAINWIDTLLSTEEKQGQRVLGNSQVGFCCLGLGCHTLKLLYNSSDTGSDDFANSVGLHNTFGQPISYATGLNSLVELNDILRVSFKEIGKVLIQHPDYYFDENVAEGIQKHYKTLNTNF